MGYPMAAIQAATRRGSSIVTYADYVNGIFGSRFNFYYRQIESAGGTAMYDSKNGYNGSYNGPTLSAVASPVSGEYAPSYDGTGDDVDIYPGISTMNLSTAGGLLGWAKMPSSVWTDGVRRDILSAYFLNGDAIMFSKAGTSNNQLWATLTYGATVLSAQPTFSSSDWFSWCLTWDKSQDKFILMINGSVVWAELTGLGNWSGGMYTEYCRLGGFGGGTDPLLGSTSNVLGVDGLVSAEDFKKFTEGAKYLKRVTVIGDSIATGWYTWAYLLAGKKGYQLIDHAVLGTAIMNGLSDQVAAAATDDADYCIFEHGTNDDNAGNMTTLKSTLGAQIDIYKASNPRAQLFYLGVLPRWTDTTGATPVAKANIRTAQQEVCSAKGVTYIDTFTSPWITAAQTDEGIHPTIAVGHPTIATQMVSVLP